MKTIYSITLLMVLIATPATKSQIEGDQPLVEEVDDVTEGSGFGVLEAPEESTTKLEQEPIIDITEPTPELITNTPQDTCPEPCSCSVEGGEIYSFTVDCSDKELSELPFVGLDEKTTILKLQNNNLTSLPKAIAQLKGLKVLNLDNNYIDDFEPGSISELPNLTQLTLSNNRLLEYPQELQNGIDLERLEELDLSGNDISSTLTVENFGNFKSLKKLTLPSIEPVFFELLCTSLNDTLTTVCVGSCAVSIQTCPASPQVLKTDILDVTLTETLNNNTVSDGESTSNSLSENGTTETPMQGTEELQNVETTTKANENIISMSNISRQRAAITSVTTEKEIAELTAIAISGEIPQEGAATSNTNTGGVDKSLIGIIVAGMVLVVAGITIQKNWSSLKAKCGSGPRPPQAAVDRNGHGVPEEEPLQNKDNSPV